MSPSLVVTVGLLLQAVANAHPVRARPAPDPVRISRADSIVSVTHHDPGHLLVLYVDPIGRIGVLFPMTPDDSTAMSVDAPVEVLLPPAAQGNPATFVAVRSRWAFDFTVLRTGSRWNYQDAWLLQPTAGDPLAALLEIADRVTDGRPYDYGVATYLRDGTVTRHRTPLQPTVCLSCVRQGISVAATQPASETNNVDCSNASLTNSFCGVANANVSITNQVAYEAPPTAAPATETVYVPYYQPVFVRGERFRFPRGGPPPIAPAVRSSFAASPIAPRLIVPSGAQLHTYTGRRH